MKGINYMLFEEKPKNSLSHFNKIMITVVVISLLIGGGTGFLASYLYLNSFIKQTDNGFKIEQIEKVSLLEEESATIDVVSKVSPSVVSIVITKEVSAQPDFMDFGFPFNFRLPNKNTENQPLEKVQVGGGTGFIVSADGLIATNRHVVLDDVAEYTVVTQDGQKYDAKVVDKDTIHDIAVIKIEANDLPALALGDSDNIEIGQTVIAIGNALAEFQNTVTRGVISGINRRIEAGGGNGFSEIIEEAIQTDAAINPGNSGGPLLNLKGQAIGINTAVSQAGQSVGFAIPINEVKQIIESIAKYGKIVRPFLGVRYMILNEKIAKTNNLPVDYGALIVRGESAEYLAVVPGSPADKAGLVENDIILEVNGQRIDEDHSLARILAQHEPDEEVELKILHDGEEKIVRVNLSERQEQ